MKKIIEIVVFIILFLIIPKPAYAQFDSSAPYFISSFIANISVEKDTSIKVEELISVFFNESRHGIFRTIPTIYSANGRTINARLKVKSVTDENLTTVPYEISKDGKSVEIKIGDPDTLVRGKVNYVIEYEMQNIIQRFADHDELYWNVAGGDWDTEIKAVTAIVNSPYAEITSVE